MLKVSNNTGRQQQYQITPLSEAEFHRGEKVQTVFWETGVEGQRGNQQKNSYTIHIIHTVFQLTDSRCSFLVKFSLGCEDLHGLFKRSRYTCIILFRLDSVYLKQNNNKCININYVLCMSHLCKGTHRIIQHN